LPEPEGLDLDAGGVRLKLAWPFCLSELTAAIDYFGVVDGVVGEIAGG